MEKEKVMEYQLLEQQLQQISGNLQNIEQNIGDIKNILKTLDDFKSLKKGDDILVPVANGIFAKATLHDSKKLKVNVGSSVIVEKDIESTKKMMEAQIEELERYKKETAGYYEQMFVRMQSLQQELVKTQDQEKP